MNNDQILNPAPEGESFGICGLNPGIGRRK
jgi:hypothetical protein